MASDSGERRMVFDTRGRGKNGKTPKGGGSEEPMASDSGERRMVFDTRGRRKNVIRVVYAVLALLMGASLFVAVGPFNLAEIVGNGSGGSAAEVLDEQSERIEGRLAKDPGNEQLLLALTRTRIAAGNAQVEPGTETTAAVIHATAQDDYEAALGAWLSYLKQAGDDPNPAAAQLVAGTFFRLAESGSVRGESAADRGRGAAQSRLAQFAGDLRVLQRRLRRRRPGEQGGHRAGTLESGSKRGRKTARRIPQIRQGLPKTFPAGGASPR